MRKPDCGVSPQGPLGAAADAGTRNIRFRKADHAREPAARADHFRNVADNIARGWLFFLAALAPTLGIMLVLKHVLLLEGGYWATVVSLGVPADSRVPAAAFTFLQKLTFFRWDLAIWAILVPLAFAALSRILSFRVLIVGILVANVALVSWLWVQRIAWLFTGRFLTWPFIQDGVIWAARHHHDLALYTPPSVARKVAASVILALILPLVVLYFEPGRRLSRAWTMLSRAGLIFFLAVLAVSFAPWLPKTAFQNSTTGIIVRYNSSTTDKTSLKFANASNLELEDEYHKLADSPPLKRYVSPYHGKARDFDLIVWVCETLPVKAIAARGGLAGFPNLGRLAKSSLILDQHYTPSPYSSTAGFALLTAMYPPNSLEWVFRANGKGQVQQIRGLLSELQRMHYETEAFMPGDASFDSDLQLVRVAGAKKTFISDVHQQAYEKTPWERRLQLDEIAFAELKRSVTDWTLNGDRYAAMFFPEIGHAPWQNVTGLPGNPTRLQLGDALAGLQDQWFGELIDLLARSHRLEKTVILVTGDHGIRTLNEDPDLPRAMLDDYTFHVPLLLYAPGAFEPNTTVQGVTSHIDTAPSLLDLLGDEEQPEFFQGLPFWDPGIARRKVFFLGAATVGSTGLHVPGRYYAVQTLTGLVFGNNSMHFAGPQLLGPQEARKVVSDVDALAGLQGAWIERASRQ